MPFFPCYFGVSLLKMTILKRAPSLLRGCNLDVISRVQGIKVVQQVVQHPTHAKPNVDP